MTTRRWFKSESQPESRIFAMSCVFSYLGRRHTSALVDAYVSQPAPCARARARTGRTVSV